MKQETLNTAAGTEARLSGQEIHEALYDGADLPVTYQDGRAEVVKVRKVPRNEFAAYSLVIGEVGGDESGECAFYVAGKDAAWAQSLSDESFDSVLAEGQRLNFPRFAAWFERQSRKLGLVRQRKDLIQEAVQTLADNPTLRSLLGSTNGSATKVTARPNSGDGARTS